MDEPVQQTKAVAEVSTKTVALAESRWMEFVDAYLTVENIKIAVILTLGVRGAAWFVINFPSAKVGRYFETKLGQKAKKYIHHLFALVFSIGMLYGEIGLFYSVMLGFGAGFLVDVSMWVWNHWVRRGSK